MRLVVKNLNAVFSSAAITSLFLAAVTVVYENFDKSKIKCLEIKCFINQGEVECLVLIISV